MCKWKSVRSLVTVRAPVASARAVENEYLENGVKSRRRGSGVKIVAICGTYRFIDTLGP